MHGTERPHSADFALTVYRLVQEALTNTLRHANARHVFVRLDWLNDQLRVQVSDDGRGLHEDASVWGRGLIGMRERVRAFGGVLDIGPGEGGIGLQVSASLPLPSATGTGTAHG